MKNKNLIVIKQIIYIHLLQTFKVTWFVSLSVHEKQIEVDFNLDKDSS